MIVRMIVTGLVALSLSSVPLSYSADRAPSPQTTRTAPASIQRPQPTHLPKALRIFVQEDLSTPESWRRELAYWANKVGIATFFVEKDEPYDLRILLASDVGSGYGSCSPAFGDALSSCNVTVSLHFVSAVALSPDGKLQFTETGVGNPKRGAITPLARKLAKRLSLASSPTNRSVAHEQAKNLAVSVAAPSDR
jgi:hypothetical protein